MYFSETYWRNFSNWLSGFNVEHIDAEILKNRKSSNQSADLVPQSKYHWNPLALSMLLGLLLCCHMKCTKLRMMMCLIFNFPFRAVSIKPQSQKAFSWTTHFPFWNQNVLRLTLNLIKEKHCFCQKCVTVLRKQHKFVYQVQNLYMKTYKELFLWCVEFRLIEGCVAATAGTYCALPRDLFAYKEKRRGRLVGGWVYLIGWIKCSE